MPLLITHIKSLYGVLSPDVTVKRGAAMADFAHIDNAYLLIENGIIKEFGEMAELEKSSNSQIINSSNQINAEGRLVLPTFVDSHTHIVFARTREEEFVMKIKGATYEDIAAAGGGILNSARRLQAATEDELFEAAWHRLQELISKGTGAIEIKSGYGLTVANELKMLRVVKRLKEKAPIPVKATFLGAHTYPADYKQNHEGYLQLIFDEMLPAIAAEGLADYIDVFCEKGFFSVEETARILEAGAKHGLKAKIHGNQLDYSGGVQVAVAHNAVSVDHLEHAGDAEIEVLKNSNTLPVGLPGCSFFLGLPYTSVRKLINAGLPVVLASDFNPGSSPAGDMRFITALGCIQMKLTPEEAFNATTINGAAALELSKETGSITVGKKANFIVTKPIPSLAWIPYAHQNNWIENVFINGIKV
ncbi:MAG: imidazolonepropionase [Bacteroidetes bacterium]|nr:MAG: imidazolonepropionase [Bacteroidota bacterium]